MNFLLDFVKGLSPRLKQRDLEEELRLLRSELEKDIIPTYETAADYFKASKLKAPVNLSLDDSYFRSFDTRKHKKDSNFILSTLNSLKAVVKNLDYIETAVEALFTSDTVVEGISAKQATVLRAVASLNWASRYAGDLLSFVYAQETYNTLTTGKNKGTKLEGLDDPRPIKVKQDEVIKGMAKFATILSDFAVPTSDFEKSFVKIPEVLLTSKNFSAVESHYTSRDLDPFYTPALNGFFGSPIWSITLAIEEFRVKRYRAKEDKKKSLELKLLQLKAAEQGKSTPELQRQIEALQKRIDSLDADLQEFEDSVK